ncbi:MAG: hypothetical protein JO147_11495 [Actinobacteria bacterium]|nr:hypothetical protein [Actinomycetota bacterium]
MAGIPAESLSDEDLRRELGQLERTASDIEVTGTPQQRRTHVERERELRAETVRRAEPPG